MSGNYRREMDQKDMIESLIMTFENFVQDRLIDKSKRIEQKEQCAERLAAVGKGNDEDREIRYSDQAVLANLDWGIDALEEAINTSNPEAKVARLDHAEKMLQVSAMLNCSQKTAGVPNFYLSAWAHLNLAYLGTLRNNLQSAVLHILEMFIKDPFFSRIDFAPELWKSLFVPHMDSVVGWYLEERRRILMDVIPDTCELSFTLDFDEYFNESLILSVRPEQTERIQKLERLYGESLNENTKLYAKYYKDLMIYDPSTSRKVIPMLPIAEPPMMPLHEASSYSIPDYVKFGPLLPSCAGFSPVLNPQENALKAPRLNAISATSENLEDSAAWDTQYEIPESKESVDDPVVYMETNDGARGVRIKDDDAISVVSHGSISLKKYEATTSQRWPIQVQSKGHSPRNSSPTDSTEISHAMCHFPKAEPTSVVLLSPCAVVSLISTSLPDSSHSFGDKSKASSPNSDGEMEGYQKTKNKSISHTGHGKQMWSKSSINRGDEGSHSVVSSPSSDVGTPRSRPPKDFVCPITGQIFNDPVTLETGQTYERKAIQEWMNMGNTTCPITRHPLCAASLPKTNYVLKRLITSWNEQHPELSQDNSDTPQNYMTITSQNVIASESFLYQSSNISCDRSISSVGECKPHIFMRDTFSTSPTSAISQTAIGTVINALKPYVLCLCNSEDLPECEEAVLTLASIWKDFNTDAAMHSYLSSPTIINGFVELLSVSLNRDVLKTIICILSKLTQADNRVCELLTSMNSDFRCLVDLLKKGLSEAAILMYLLKPSFSLVSSYNLLPTFIHIISSKNEDSVGLQYVIAYKDAAIALLEIIVRGGDDDDRSHHAMDIISGNGIPALMNCLTKVDNKQSVVSILLCCVRADTTCRNMVANGIELFPVLELIHGGNINVRGLGVDFLYELVQLRRRTLYIQILNIIKEEGTFSTKHTLLVYLQVSPMEQKARIATLLLQLDLLDTPRKMSIYREEAMEALLEALQRKDFPSSQIMALSALSSLSGCSRASKRPCMESYLLTIAGFNQPYSAVIKWEEVRADASEITETMKEEEKTWMDWEKRIVFILSNHDRGSIFKALEECFISTSVEIAKSSLVVATWLVHMLYSLPDCGTRDVARKSLLEKFINVLLSSKKNEEKILASLALRRFVSEPDELNEVGVYAKTMWNMLRQLKKSCTVAHDIMKALMKLKSINAAELWSCNEGPELDLSINKEVLSVLHTKNRVISSHADGTIKVWDTGRTIPQLIQEVHEHSKAVTCLFVSPSHDKLYSGSLDKTIRVWTIEHEEIRCRQVHDVKDAVLVLTANASFACFSSQGNGVKVYNWSGAPKHVNFNKQVKCLAFAGDKLFCGCSGYIIQEVDLKTLASSTFYSGAKKLLGKPTIYSLVIHGDLILAGGSSVDGVAGKTFSLSSKAVMRSLSTDLDIQHIAVSNDFIFTSTKCGIIEVWQKERMTKIAFINSRCEPNTRITSLASDPDGHTLFAGTSDGKLQTWNLD